MTTFLRLLPALALIVAGCAQAVDRQQQFGAAYTRETRTVLTGREAESFTRQCSRVSPGPVSDAWAPSEADLDALDHQLGAYVSERLRERGAHASPVDYYRQVAGFVIEGRQIIYVNGVARGLVERERDPARPFDWRTQAISVCDGGALSFGVEYDPTTQAFANFEFNYDLGRPVQPTQ